jgi:hypothetical protein
MNIFFRDRAYSLIAFRPSYENDMDSYAERLILEKGMPLDFIVNKLSEILKEDSLAENYAKFQTIEILRSREVPNWDDENKEQVLTYDWLDKQSREYEEIMELAKS